MAATSTLFAIGTAASAGASALQGVAAYQQGQARAKAAEANAVAARQRADATESQQRRDSARQLAQARVQAAASGTRLSDSSSARALIDMVGQQEEQALLIRHQGTTQAMRARQRAQASRAQGSAGLILGVGGAVGKGLQGAAVFGNEFGGGQGPSFLGKAFKGNLSK